MKSHVVIAGTGRAGTTFLVQLLDACGLETHARALKYYDAARAGFDGGFWLDDVPHIVKHPYLSEKLRAQIESGRIDPQTIDAIIVPIRDLDSAVASRIRRFVRGGLDAPGGLWRGKRPGRQRLLLAEAVYALLQTAAEFRIRVVPLSFPLFVNDGEYAWDRLRRLLPEVDRATFLHAHDAVAMPSAISTNLSRESALELGLLDLLWYWRRVRRFVDRHLPARAAERRPHG